MTPATADRDRDAAGRPKNARPRDGLGRPLQRGMAGEPVTPDDLRLEPGEAVLAAQRLIDAGRPFHAHEVLEAVWKSAPAGQRDMWKGLAQIAVGLTHARRGNSRGAVALLRRGAQAISAHTAGQQAAHTAGQQAAHTAGQQAAHTAGQQAAHTAGQQPAHAAERPAGEAAATAGRPHPPPANLDLAGARQAAMDLADRIARAGLGSLSESDLRLPLATAR